MEGGVPAWIYHDSDTTYGYHYVFGERVLGDVTNPEWAARVAFP